MRSKLIRSLMLLLLLHVSMYAWAQILPSPKEHFGFHMGDDYQLANYTQTEAYFKKIAAASDRVKLIDIGLTEEGRHQYMLILSSPENLKKLDRYKEISQKMARAENINEEQARALAAEGKAVVWIDGGLHATETVGAHQLIETIWQLSSRKDAETRRILENTIILLTHANPDGQELVANWYMREPNPEKRSLENVPRLYQKYVGHDNNRDFYMMNMKESQNISKQLFIEWIPQIMYNHHQRGPAGSVLAGPPYRDPFNYVYDPLVVTSIDAVGAAMNNRLNAEGKPGYTQRAGSQFSTWWNGGLRTTPYFHNMIGLLTEIIGGPTPENIPLVTQRLVPNGATPNPVTPQKWHFRQSIDYSVSLNYAVLDYAARHHDDLLYNIYRMGKNSIDRGNTDTWTLLPNRVESIEEVYKKDQAKIIKSAGNSESAQRRSGLPSDYYSKVIQDPAMRDARSYIIPADQADFPTAVRFVNALIYSGIQVHKATADFKVGSKKYPAGSYVIQAAQAFRPHVLDMFEPQDHPNDFQFEGGPPVRPYDAAGWTLAYQMGVAFDRILDGMDAPLTQVPYGELQSPPKKTLPSAKGGYLLSASANNSFIAVNELLQANVDVYRVQHAGSQKNDPVQGTFYVPAAGKSKEILERAAVNLGLEIKGVLKKPAGNLAKVSPMRIALWDTYGGSMPSGWIRWMMEQFNFPIDVIYPKDIDAGNLIKKYDIIVFVGGSMPGLPTGDESMRSSMERGPKPENTPTEYKDHLGRLTADKSIPQIKEFMQEGGHVITIGSSAILAQHLDLPVKNALVSIDSEGKEQPLPATKYYIPGSILRVSFDNSHPAAWGMPAQGDVYFNNSPVFKISPDAIVKGNVKPLAWFSDEKPLRSGWAWGQSYLHNTITAFVAPIGAGNLYVFGPEITFRSQSHGTFKLLFNQLYKTEKSSGTTTANL